MPGSLLGGLKLRPRPIRLQYERTRHLLCTIKRHLAAGPWGSNAIGLGEQARSDSSVERLGIEDRSWQSSGSCGGDIFVMGDGLNCHSTARAFDPLASTPPEIAQ